MHGERPAEGVQPEDRIGAGDDVDARDGRLGDEVPVDRLPEPVVEAHAVQVHRHTDGAADQRRGQEAPVAEVVLPGVALVTAGVH